MFEWYLNERQKIPHFSCEYGKAIWGLTVLISTAVG